MWLMKDNPTIMLLSHIVHNVAFVIFVIAVPVHMYLGTLANPGTLKLMISGTLPVDEARRRYPKWMKAAGKM
jgi:formate dehydrogenase subunit gamma